ncbi:MerR family transcriptional regulator [Clostridium sp. 'deep sea']|uniref:MerR family transcriptional regulator n=1 Tax=Clostridium sp. 'deep sea' TaxID=2779445 RepID=UPI0018965A2A|nr:MerR family transcriptional regulator [Clostridium sp. 'deep sea']QOR36496.1 MerR family transcriptional regulator [Clostridium sp. 'deep sea']
MENKYSIGQMAKMFNLPVKTLRYYDEINLFKPQFINEKTGYRYYSADQIEHLDTVLFLKILGMPLKKIKKHLDNPVIDDFLMLLKEQQKQTERKIEELKDIHNKFQTRIDAIEEIKRIEEFNKVIEKRISKRRIVLLKESFYLNTSLELLLKKLERKINIMLPVIIGNVILRMSKDNMQSHKFYEYSSVGMLLESIKIKPNLVEEIPESDFVCIWFKGTHEQAHLYYNTLLNYIQQHNYTIIGNSIERTISNQFITKNTEYHITGIEIPVKK